jgi:hypothetical protein
MLQSRRLDLTKRLFADDGRRRELMKARVYGVDIFSSRLEVYYADERQAPVNPAGPARAAFATPSVLRALMAEVAKKPGLADA